MRLKMLIAAVLAVVPAFALAETKVGGQYAEKGTNFDGSAYRGRAEIVMTSSGTCRITWWIGATTYEGICMRDENALAAAYKMGSDLGLVIYQIKKDGSLSGIWTTADRPGVGTDVLTPQ
jgi:hypothetical protein